MNKHEVMWNQLKEVVADRVVNHEEIDITELRHKMISIEYRAEELEREKYSEVVDLAPNPLLEDIPFVEPLTPVTLKHENTRPLPPIKWSES